MYISDWLIDAEKGENKGYEKVWTDTLRSGLF